MKVGNTDFNPDVVKKMSFKKFESIYAGKLKGCDLKETFLKLGGKIKIERKKDK